MRAVVGNTNLESMTFSASEPVLQGRPLRAPGLSPCFGQTDAWDLSNLYWPANIGPSSKALRFEVFDDPSWNVLAREYAMVRLNPTHQSVTDAEIYRSNHRGKAPRTVIAAISNLAILYRWIKEEGAPLDLRIWPATQQMQWLDARGRGLSKARLSQSIKLLKDLHDLRAVFSFGGLADDPFPGMSATDAAGFVQSQGVTTEPISPDAYVALLQAAWKYIEDFSSDILAARERWAALAAQPPSQKSFDDFLTWSENPESLVPLHAQGSRGAQRGDPNWRMLSLLVGLHPDYMGHASQPATIKARSVAFQMIEAGRCRIGGLGTNISNVELPDGSNRPWHDDFDGTSVGVEISALRAACYVFIAALTGMRDSEVQELQRKCVTTWYGSHVIESNNFKTAQGENARWAVIDPVVRAIEVLGDISWHENYLFVPISQARSRGRGVYADVRSREFGINANVELEEFVLHVNQNVQSTGLSPIEETCVSSQFRRTFAIFTSQFPMAEIALNWQFGHAASRMSTTTSYFDEAGSWTKELNSEQESVALDQLYDRWIGYRNGGAIAGPGGTKQTDLFEHLEQHIEEAFPGQIADERLVKRLLRDPSTNFYAGTFNDCMFMSAADAECLKTVATDYPKSRPILNACSTKCPQFSAGQPHKAHWLGRRDRITGMLGDPNLAEPKRELLQEQLSESVNVIRTIEGQVR